MAEDELETLYEISTVGDEVITEPDAALRAAALKAANALDDAVAITSYFLTVEYVDRDGHRGLMNITPRDVPTWQLTAIQNHGGEMWDRFAEAVQFPSVSEEDDEG